MSDPLDPLARGVPARASTKVEAPPFDGIDPDDLPHGLSADAMVGTLDDDVALGDEERDVLVALAAFQLRYGEAAEALAYLMAARKLFPRDADVLRLCADALVRLGRVDEADETLRELDRITRRPHPLATLSRALVRLAQGRAQEARRLFKDYREASLAREETRARRARPERDLGDGWDGNSAPIGREGDFR